MFGLIFKNKIENELKRREQRGYKKAQKEIENKYKKRIAEKEKEYQYYLALKTATIKALHKQHQNDVKAELRSRKRRDYTEYFCHVAAPQIQEYMKEHGYKLRVMDFAEWETSRSKKLDDTNNRLLRIAK